MSRLCALLVSLLTLAALAEPASPEGLVDVVKLDFSIRNGSGGKCALRRKTVDALSAVAAVYRMEGLSLKLQECYHPKSSAQPPCGDHSRGDAVDLTVVDRMGIDQLQTGAKPAKARARLAREMRRAGFVSEGKSARHFVLSGGERPPSDDLPLRSIK